MPPSVCYVCCQFFLGGVIEGPCGPVAAGNAGHYTCRSRIRSYLRSLHGSLSYSSFLILSARGNLKRGGGVLQVSLDEALTISQQRRAELIELDHALSTLAKLNFRQSQVVELRFFGGLTEVEIAEILQTSPRSVSADWSMARAWLLRELSAKKRHDA